MASIVIFSADWCRYCAPLKKAYRKAGVDFDVVDTDSAEGHKLSEQYGIDALPTVAVRVGGKLWAVGDDESAEHAWELQKHQVCAVGTKECGVPADVARRLGAHPFDEEGEQEIDSVELLMLASCEQLRAIVCATEDVAPPRRKAELAECVAGLLDEGHINGADISRQLDRFSLEQFADALGVDGSGGVKKLRELVAESLDSLEDVDGAESDCSADDDEAAGDHGADGAEGKASADAPGPRDALNKLIELMTHPATPLCEASAALDRARSLRSEHSI